MMASTSLVDRSGRRGYFPAGDKPGVTLSTLEYWVLERVQIIASGGKWGYIGLQPKGKTEIPG
jgi:hypothetical protein